MTGKRTHRTSISERLIWIGIGLAVVFWFIESAVHVKERSVVYHRELGRILGRPVYEEKG